MTDATASEAASTTDTSSSKRLTPAEWEQVVVLWESGAVTLQDLEDRFGISKPSLSEGLKKRGAVKARRAKEFAKQTEESLKSDAQRKAEEIKKFRGQYQKYGDYIMTSAILELQALRSKPRSERSREDNARIFTAIKYVAEIYAHVRDNKFHLYDLYNEQDQDDDLPDIGVTEYTPDEIEAINNRFEVPLLQQDDAILTEAQQVLSEMEVPAGDP